jgi:hypothetical protein
VDIYRYSSTVPSGHVVGWSSVYLIYREAKWELCQSYVLILQWRWCWGYSCCLKRRDMNLCFLKYIHDCTMHRGRHWKLKSFEVLPVLFPKCPGFSIIQSFESSLLVKSLCSNYRLCLTLLLMYILFAIELLIKKSAVLCFAYLALRKAVLLFMWLPLSIDCISHCIQGVTFRFPNDKVHSYTLLKCLYNFGTLLVCTQAVWGNVTLQSEIPVA